MYVVELYCGKASSSGRLSIDRCSNNEVYAFPGSTLGQTSLASSESLVALEGGGAAQLFARGPSVRGCRYSTIDPYDSVFKHNVVAYVTSWTGIDCCGTCLTVDKPRRSACLCEIFI